MSREILTAVESTATQSLRLALTRQFAEVLLRSVSGSQYKIPEAPADTFGKHPLFFFLNFNFKNK